jgi:serine/threonine protein phosphatase PrpC
MSRNVPHRVVAAQTIGGRERQEDDFAVVDVGSRNSERLVLVVADGMGGHARAADVARIGVRGFCDRIKTGIDPMPSRLRPALESANHEIARAAARDPAVKGAGCTLVAAAIEEMAISWVSVGDSSLYLFRQRKLHCLNKKHVEPVATGSGGQRKTIYRLRSALMGKELRLVDSSNNPLPLLPDDCIIVASDGLGSIGDRKIASILRRSAARTPAEILDLLIKSVRSTPIVKQDNTTVIFYRVPPTEKDGHGWIDEAFAYPKWNLVVVAVLSATLLLTIILWLLT